MTSPEHLFRPPEIAALDTDSDTRVSGLPEPENPYQTHVPNISKPAEILASTPDAPTFLQDNSLSASSIAIEGVSPTPPVTNVLLAVGDGSPLLQKPWGEVKKARRQVWQETGTVPPIAGGSENYKPNVSIPVSLAMWFEGKLDAQGEKWVAENFPELIENSHVMSVEEFSDWFLKWWLVDLDWSTVRAASQRKTNESN